MFGSVVKYLCKKDPPFGEALSKLCSYGIIGDYEGGLTWVNPTGGALRELVIRASSDDSIDTIESAIVAIKRHVFHPKVDTVDQWDRATSDEGPAPASLRGATKEEFAIDPNVTIWTLRGNLVYNSQKQGSYEFGDKFIPASRQKIILALEEFVFNQMKGHFTNKSKLRLKLSEGASSVKNIMVEHTLSLLKHLREKQNPKYWTLLPLFCMDHMDIYFMLEPYTMQNNILSDDEINEWWEHQKSTDLVDIDNIFSDFTSNNWFGNQQMRIDALQFIRSKARELMATPPTGLPVAIERAYDDTFRECKFLTHGLNEYYASRPGLKLIQDELRFIAAMTMLHIEKNPDAAQFRALTHIIGDVLYAYPNKQVHPIVDAIRIKNTISPIQEIESIKRFVQSAYFMALPWRTSDFDALKLRWSVPLPAPFDYNALWTATKWGELDLHKDKPLYQTAKVRDWIISLETKGVDPDLIQFLSQIEKSST